MLENLLKNIANIAALLCDASISFFAVKNADGFYIISPKAVKEIATSTINTLLQQTLHHPNNYLVIADINNSTNLTDGEIRDFLPDINFFAGFSLMDNNKQVIGCLFLTDKHAKQLADDAINKLRLLANEAAEILNSNTDIENLQEKIQTLEKVNSLYEQTNLVAKIGYWEVNYVTNKLFWSDTTKAIHGVSIEYIPDVESAINFFKEGWSKNRIIECVNDASTNNKPFDEELQLITLSGQEIWVRAKGNAEFMDEICTRLYGTFQNIDAYKQQQLIREQSEIKYRSIIENSLTAFLLTTPLGVILEANKAAEDMFGYSVKELCELGRKGIIDVNDPNLYTLLKQREINGKAQGELTGIRKNGERFSLFLTTALFKDVHGEIKTSLSIIDTTETKKAEEELRISKDEFSTTFEYASIGMALVGSKGEWIRVNKSLNSMLGYTNDELLKLTFQDITHPDDLNIDLEFLKKLVKDEIETYQMEKRYYTKSGEMLWVNLSVSKVKKADGSVKHFISQIENINDRKKAEQLLAISVQRFKGIFNSSYQLIGFLSPAGLILEVNETALQFAGITHDDVVGKYYWECPWWRISEDTKHLFIDAMAKASTGEFAQCELEIFGADNNKLAILFNLKPLLDNDKKVFAIISEGRPIQDIADARTSLIQKNEELKEFSAIASHDLKEPLRMVHIFMQMLEKNYAAQLDERANKYISTAIDGAKRMAVLIDDLLIYSQLGSEQAEKEIVNTQEIVEEIVAFQKMVFMGKEVHFEIGELPYIVGIKTPIKMLFENLIGNALKYQKPDNEPSIKITSKKIKKHIQFAISDNGIGIAKQYVEQDFKLFKRLHSRSEYSGTGMGLSICKKIVENMGGRIWVESIEGEGSTIFFTAEESYPNKI